MKLFSRLFKALCALSGLTLLFFAFDSNVLAQDLDQAVISGRILDSNGAAVPGVSVTAILSTNNQERTVTSDGQGRFSLFELQPGVYQITIAAKGFATVEQKDLTLLAGRNLTLNFALTPAEIRPGAIVVSTDDVPSVDTTRTIVGGTLARREIEELPNPARNQYDFALTFGGVTEEALSTRDLSEDKGGRNTALPGNTPEEAGIFALSGGTAYSNNITIDGFDNNDDRAATFRFQPSIEAVDEVQIVTNQFSSEYGRASGGRVNLRTRSGTKNLRGRLFYFFADDNLNANTNRNKARGIARPDFQQNILGFNLGGPIPFGYFKNKTFFFTSYERDRISETTVTDTYVPLAQNPRFPLPIATNPNETFVDGGAALGRLLEETATPRQNQSFIAKIDHNFTNQHSAAVSFQAGRLSDRRQFRGGNSLPDALIGRTRNTDAINIADNFAFSSKAVNQFRFQYSTLKPRFSAGGENNTPVVLVNFREPNDASATTLVAGASSLGASDRRESRLQFQETFNYLAADAHSLKFGTDVQKVKTTFVDLTNFTGVYNFSNAGNFLQSTISRFRQNFFTDSTVNNTYTSVFAADEWRIKQNLTVSYGLRYERETVIDDKNNFAPRAAAAFNPFKDNKGVIRFGAGIFYNRALLRTIDDFRRGASVIEFDTNRIPTGASRTQLLDALSRLFPKTLDANSQLVRDYVSAGYNNTPFLRRLKSGLEIPESYQFNVGFEREIGNGLVFETNLTFNRTAKLWRETNLNAPRVPVGFKDFTQYLLAVSQGSGFDNRRRADGTRPIYNVASAGDTVKFQLTPIVVGSQQVDVRTIGRAPNAVTFVNLNSFNSSAAVEIAQATVNFTRPDPRFTQIEQVESIGNSWYRGLVIELRRRYKALGAGFAANFRAVYTLSKLEDDGIVNTSSAQISGDFAAERARSLLDRRHRLVVSGTVGLPKWLAGLNVSPIFRFGSSAPFNLSIGGDAADDRNLDDVNTDRPNFSGDLRDIRYRLPGEQFNANLANAFTLPVLGSRAGNLPRNAGRGPLFYVFDLNLSRQIKFNEKMSLRPTIEIDNVLNSTVFSFGSEYINFNALSASSTVLARANFERDFLIPTRTFRPRQIRIGVRFDF